MKSIFKKKDFDVFLLIVLICFNISLIVFVDYYDELWNFANCYKMFNGYKIYEELNVIVTPLFLYISQIFFYLFGANLLSFRIYNVFISALFFILIYLIFKSLKVVKRRSVLYTLIFILIFNTIVAAGANYNIMVMMPVLIALLLIIRKKENNILFGMLLFATFITKQNIYVLFAAGIFFYKILSQSEMKKKLGDLAKIYLISLAGIFVFLIYMYLDGNLYNFYNYCFGGISEFGIKNLYIDISNSRFLYISIITTLLTFFIIHNKKINQNLNQETIKNIKDLLCFGLPLTLMSFPIFNYYHATLGSTIILIELFYIIENALIKNLAVERKKEKIFYFILIAIYILYLFYGILINLYEIKNGKIILDNNGAFYGTIMQKEDYEDIKIICNYIEKREKQNVDVKILSYKANLYMVKLNKNNGILDLAFVGNLGKDGENGIIAEIQNLKNTLILIQTSEEIFWQESKNAREYIINNYDKIGEIQEYSIYYIK